MLFRSLSLLWRYISKTKLEPQQYADDLAAAVDAGCTDPTGTDPDGCVIDPRFQKIKAYNYFDFATRWAMNDHIEFTLTVANIFNRKPPTVGGTVGTTTYNGGNTFPSTYDALGRRYAVGARLKF